MLTNFFKISAGFFLSVYFLVSPGCSNRGANNPVEDNGEDTTITTDVAVWQTSGDKSKLLVKIATIAMKENTGDTNDVSLIKVDAAQTYQAIDGFGAALTGSSAYVINHHLAADTRTQLLKELFTKDGIGIDYIRVSIGASDFSPKDFSYDDHAGDTLMQHFSLDADKPELIPLLKQIVNINPNIQIMASPWSAPAWMKTSNSMEGGHLKKECYNAYARYFVKYIQEMKTEGINISSISCQNEPMYGNAAYPCMLMFATEQRDFIRDHLGPMFAANSINTKIILYDHNWDLPLYGDTILNDHATAQYVAGTGFHAYAGTVEAMNELHSLHPDKDLYFTELSGGNWAPDFNGNIKWFTENLTISAVRYFSKNVLLWNLALDENHGPTNNGCLDCRGVVTVATNGSITRNEEYYILGHAGKFIQQGAKRCYSDDLPAQNIRDVAFINPDGTKVVVAINTATSAKKILIREETKRAEYTLQPNAVYTFYWK